MKEKQKETVIPTTVMSPPEKEEEEEKDESDHDAFDPEGRGRRSLRSA